VTGLAEVIGSRFWGDINDGMLFHRGVKIVDVDEVVGSDKGVGVDKVDDKGDCCGYTGLDKKEDVD